ncbi:hypothetical protein B0H13DRAFT_1747171 [Mycena leptocephala]|nr:hypothetical protein B0H13DRAFT_1747171 [Mycena leptocephala]
MTDVASLYNSLPTIEEADKNFVDRTQLFSKLAPLLAAYEYKFGVCLVHAHCKLEEGEMMVASGHISEPQKDLQCYPERWLASGEPYEFTTESTATPPAELFTEFKAVVGSIDLLGLYAAGDNPRSGILQEWTEGRKNITRVVTENEPGDIETGWLPGTADLTTMVCVTKCKSRARGHTESHEPTNPPKE